MHCFSIRGVRIAPLVTAIAAKLPELVVTGWAPPQMTRVNLSSIGNLRFGSAAGLLRGFLKAVIADDERDSASACLSAVSGWHGQAAE